MPVLKLPISEEQLAELEGEGDVSFFIVLERQGGRKALHVHIRRRTFYDSLYAAARTSRDRQPPGPFLEGAIVEAE